MISPLAGINYLCPIDDLFPILTFECSLHSFSYQTFPVYVQYCNGWRPHLSVKHNKPTNSPIQTRLKVSYPTSQCAAVSTQYLFIRVPPQMCRRSVVCMDTMYLMEWGTGAYPPTMRSITRSSPATSTQRVGDKKKTRLHLTERNKKKMSTIGRTNTFVTLWLQLLHQQERSES